jgi:O-antigen/teichoic acid export membrane protein
MNNIPASYQRRTSALVVVSSITTALTLFAVFRFTTELLSAKWIGAWSLIQGLFLVARVSDSGAGNNISRVVAVRVKGGTQLDLRNLTLASLSIASLPSILLALITTPVIGLYVTARFSADLDRDGLWILVWLALLTAVIAAISNILLAMCEGVFQLNYKSIVVIWGNLAGLIALLPLLNLAGPAGIGWAYVVIFGTQLVLAAIRVSQLVRSETSLQHSTIRQHIRLLWRENLHLSGIALIRLSFEPTTKFLLSLFAPLIIIAQFELALRVTTQIRIVIQSALQPLLVVGARAPENAHVNLREVFLRNDRVLSSLSLGGLVAQILAVPAIQWLGMGFYDELFTVFFAFLAAGNAVNTMGLSGYYWQLSSGSLHPLVRVQALMAAENICLGAIGLALDSAAVVVAAYSGAFAFGGLASRAFLHDVPRVTRILYPCLVVAGGVLASGLILLLHPTSIIAVSILLCCATAVGGVCLYSAYKTSRRTYR